MPQNGFLDPNSMLIFEFFVFFEEIKIKKNLTPTFF